MKTNKQNKRCRKIKSLCSVKNIKIPSASKKEAEMLAKEDKELYSEDELKKDNKEFISEAFSLSHLLTKIKKLGRK